MTLHFGLSGEEAVNLPTVLRLRFGSTTAHYRLLIANLSLLNRPKKRTIQTRGRAQFASPLRSFWHVILLSR